MQSLLHVQQFVQGEEREGVAHCALIEAFTGGHERAGVLIAF
jgi:hypothetical protein